MQDKEYQQLTAQHKKAHNRALYASLSASCMNIFLAISAVSPLAFNYVFAVVHNYSVVVWIVSIVIAIVCGHKALNNSKYGVGLYSTHGWSVFALVCAYGFIFVWIGVGCQQTIVYCMNGGPGCH
jgi:hypothetical protein